MRRIALERRRQIEGEGFDPVRDLRYESGELLLAGICYIEFARAQIAQAGLDGKTMRILRRWPWAVEWWKPEEDAVRNLEKGGALIAAELDRVVRDRRITGSVADRLAAKAETPRLKKARAEMQRWIEDTNGREVPE